MKIVAPRANIAQLSEVHCSLLLVKYCYRYKCFSVKYYTTLDANDENKKNVDPGDSFPFDYLSYPFCFLCFSSVQAQKNILHPAKIATCKQHRSSSGSLPVAIRPQNQFHTLLTGSCGELLPSI